MTTNTVAVAKLIKDVNHKFKHVMRNSFECIGFTMPQGMVIGELTKHGEMKISELSNALGLSNSTTSGIIDRLEVQKVLERTRSLVDKRIVYVKLSTGATEMYKNIRKTIEENFQKLLNDGTQEEMDKIVEGLTILVTVLERNEMNNSNLKC